MRGWGVGGESRCRPNDPTPCYEPWQAEFPDRSIVRNVIVPGANDTDPAAVAAPSIAGRSPLSSTLSAAPFSSTSPFWSGSGDHVLRFILKRIPAAGSVPELFLVIRRTAPGPPR